MTILELRTATVTAGTRTLLSEASLVLEPSQCVAIMGPSGSGKSTLLQTIAGIRAPEPDEVFLEGEDLGRLGPSARDHLRLSRMGMVFQFGEVLPELTAVENVALPSRYLGVGRATAHQRAERWLDSLGLAEVRRAHPDRMSGGQIQRVAIARAMAHEPLLVLADEPTGMLDESTSHDVVQLLVGCVRAAGAALVIVTHDHAVAAACDRVLRIDDGRLAAA